MNNLTKTLIFLSTLALGGVVDHLCFKSISIERTKSGMFILDSGHIYELVELEFNKDIKETKADSYSIIPSYGDSQSHRLPAGKK